MRRGPAADVLTPARAQPVAPVRRRYDAHWPTFLYIGVSVFLAIGAINGQNNLLFAAFGLSIAGLLFSGLLSGSALMGVAAARVTPRVARVGEPARIRYVLTNRNRFVDAMGLVITETSLGGTRRDRPAAGVLHLPARQTRPAALTFTPDGRGILPLRRVEVSSTFPFGLLRKTLVFELPAEIVVLPRRIDLPRRHLAAATSRRATGRRPRPRAGFDDPHFHGLREYRPGDPTRAIAWRASARSQSLLVAQRSAAQPQAVRIALLPPGPDVPGWLWERAVAVAAALAEQATAEKREVAFDAAWGGLPRAAAGSSRALLAMLSDLAMLDAGRTGDGDTPAGSNGATRTPPPRGAIVVSCGPVPGDRSDVAAIDVRDDAACFAGGTPPPEMAPAPLSNGARGLLAQAWASATRAMLGGKGGPA